MGQSVGGYVIESKLGEGGMGAVYVGYNEKLKRRIAVKVLLADHAHRTDVVDRFFREARAACELEHPNIVRVLDVHTLQLPAGERPYMTMEYLEGMSLGSYLKRQGPLELDDALAIFGDVLKGVSAAHARGIVHRDLKPDNIFLVERADGSGRIAKVLDFGLAKILGDDMQSAVLVKTASNVVMGTPQYMSPEQIVGTAGADHRTDIYALGVILFQMLAGRLPVVPQGPTKQLPSFGQWVLAHTLMPPEPLGAARPDLPAGIGEVIEVALCKERDQRFQTISELEIALRAARLGQPLALRPAAAPAPGILHTVTAPPSAAGAPADSATAVEPAARARLGPAAAPPAPARQTAVLDPPAAPSETSNGVPVAINSVVATPVPDSRPGAIASPTFEPPGRAGRKVWPIGVALVAAVALVTMVVLVAVGGGSSPERDAAPLGAALMPSDAATASDAAVTVTATFDAGPAAGIAASPTRDAAPAAPDAAPHRPTADRRRGTLTVTLDPTWALVEVDGKSKGQTPISVRVSSGWHRVTVTRKERKESRRVKVRAGHETVVTFDWSKPE